ncbi:MAG TPA: hypothetical protein VF717_10820 [Pyrinomonadaceae bacterium]
MPEITFKDDAEGFTIFVDGKPIESTRLADGTFYVGVFPHQNFETPEAAIQLLLDTYDVLWSDKGEQMM